ncbi:MAG TPA: hypothetical protein VH164_09760 [Ktedonobacteraceae bacterium]|nr:hypothetical protein [Ktedonobacteraceae bacterium]
MEEKISSRACALKLPEPVTLLMRPALCAGLVYVLLISLFVAARHYSALDFIHLGTVWGAHNKSGTWGYDGQFYYQIARNPLGAAQYMDNAPYRYEHLLYSLLAWMLSFGNASLVPYTLLLINLFSIVGSVEIVSRLLKAYGFSPWFSLALGLYYGQAVGLTFDTSEPFTCLLICPGFWYLEKKQLTASALWLGLATISREIAVLFPLCLAAYFVWKHQWRDASGFIILGVLPLAVLLGSLALIFGQTGVTFAPPFEHIPFAGILAYRYAPRKFGLLVLMILLPLLVSLGFLAWDLLRLRASRLTLVWAANLGLMVFLSHSTYLELVSCGRVGIAVVLAGMLYALKTRNKTLLWALQIYTLTFIIYFFGTMAHLDSFIA